LHGSLVGVVVELVLVDVAVVEVEVVLLSELVVVVDRVSPGGPAWQWLGSP
jgi:hypothetical protein